MYCCLFLVWLKILPIYIPRTPSDIKMFPEKKDIVISIPEDPGTARLLNFRIREYIIRKIDIKIPSIPTIIET